MKHATILHCHLLTIIALTLTSCVSTDSRTSALNARVETAQKDFENGLVNKAELLKALIETDLERDRLAYEKHRFMMARAPSAERLYNPPRHYKLRETVKKAKDAQQIREQEFLALCQLVDQVEEEWLARRRKVMHDRAIWGFPR